MKLPLQVLEKVRGKKWYHQRFDGCPLFLGFIGEAEVKPEKRKPAGTEARDVRVCFVNKDTGDWYLSMRDIRRGSRILTDLAKRNPNISTTLLRRWKHDEERFQAFFDAFPSVKMQQLSDARLLKLFRTYYRLAINRFTSSAIIDHFALGTDEHIANMLRREVGVVGKESDFTSIFSIATAPVHQSFINEAEMELLKIAIRFPKSQKRIVAFQQEYYWTKNNYYSSRVLSVKYFQNEINTWRRSGADLRAKFRQLRDTPAINQRKKAALFKRCRFSKLLRTLVKISEDFTWWQDERKRATYLSTHMGTRILGEMARRRKFSADLGRYLMPSEVESMFMKGVPSARELRERLKGCAFLQWNGGHVFFTGKQIAQLRRAMFPERGSDEVKDIRGLSASVGRVVGPVKIVKSVQEIQKIRSGDIIVAVMTRPDYIAGIKKAAAIVTNEGGITCHAAIVSRELGIPCVIGTKIATEVLKDGDIVEVNANHGVVTVLKH